MQLFKILSLSIMISAIISFTFPTLSCEIHAEADYPGDYHLSITQYGECL